MKAVRGQKKPRRPKKHEEVDLLKKGFSKVAQQVAYQVQSDLSYNLRY